MVVIPPSIYNAYHICPRQSWLMYRYITPQQDQTFLILGRLLGEKSFKKEKKEIYLADMKAKIDMIYKKNGEIIVAEIKRSSKKLKNGIKQLKFYLFLLEKKGIKLKGVIKIPEERKELSVILTTEDKKVIENELKLINKVINSDLAPKKEYLSICKKCAHYEFCWS